MGLIECLMRNEWIVKKIKNNLGFVDFEMSSFMKRIEAYNKFD